MSRPIRNLVVCLALVASSPSWATASFANNELGLGVGGFGLFPAGDARVEWGAPVTLEGGRYLEGGFALYLRIPLMLLKQTTGELVVGTGGQFGVRYLLLEEAVRPYVMLHLAGLWLFRDLAPNLFIGPGTGFGVDFFVTDSVSLGVRATADLYLTLTQTELKAQVSLGGAASISVYF